MWEDKFELLLKYRDLYGTVNVPNRVTNLEYPYWERSLAAWVNTQRTKNKKGTLLGWRYDKLVSVNFDFEPFETRFEQHFSDFLKFKEKYGHALVPENCTEYPSLGSWASHCRCKKISEERVKRLNEAGFVWDYIDEYWQQKYRELIEFKKKHGHFKVSEKQKGHEKLGTWTVRMRKARRHGKGQQLSEIQIKLLDDIGFPWDPVQFEWDENIRKLKEFIAIHNHCLVPIKRCEIPGLGWWVYWVRINKHKLTENQIAQLDGLGFEWNSDLAYRKRNNIKGILDNKEE